VRTDWVNPRRNVTSSGANPFENVLDASSVRRLEMAWTTTGSTFLGNSGPSLVVASNVIVAPVPFASKVVALNTDGKQLWSRSQTSIFFSAPGPAAGAGIVVVPSSDGKLHAYTLLKGAPKWTSPGPNDVGAGSPVIAGSVVFAPGATMFQALDLNSGAQKWSYTGPCTGNISTPALSGGIVVFTCTNSGGAAVLVSLGVDGTPYHNLSTVTGVTSAPAVAGGAAYMLIGGKFAAYSLSAYNPKWSLTPPFTVSEAPAVGDGIVVTCGSGGVWAVNIADGSTRFSNTAYPCSASPTIANGVIYLPANGDITMFDEFGSRLGRLGSGGGVGPVSVVDGSVYAVDSIAGVDRWTIPAAAANAARRTAAARPDVRQLHPDWMLTPYAAGR
jgi:hypothetical protein